MNDKINENQFLNKRQACEFLGISQKQFEGAVNKGQIPFKSSLLNPKGHKKYRLGDLIQWSKKTTYHIVLSKEENIGTPIYPRKLLGTSRLDALLAKQR